MSKQLRLVIDVEQKLPACVLLQACYGSDYQQIDFQLMFPTETWLINPTPNMRMVSGTLEQWRQFSKTLTQT